MIAVALLSQGAEEPFFHAAGALRRGQALHRPVRGREATGSGRCERALKGVRPELARSRIEGGDGGAIPHPRARGGVQPRLGDERVKTPGVRHAVGLQDENRGFSVERLGQSSSVVGGGQLCPWKLRQTHLPPVEEYTVLSAEDDP